MAWAPAQSHVASAHLRGAACWLQLAAPKCQALVAGAPDTPGRAALCSIDVTWRPNKRRLLLILWPDPWQKGSVETQLQTPSRWCSCRHHASFAPTSLAADLTTPFAGEDGEAPAADPKPVVQLPPAGPLTTGEEEEESVFKTEGTLFEFFKGGQGWRERGRGELRLNRSTARGEALGKRSVGWAACMGAWAALPASGPGAA